MALVTVNAHRDGTTSVTVNHRAIEQHVERSSLVVGHARADLYELLDMARKQIDLAFEQIICDQLERLESDHD